MAREPFVAFHPPHYKELEKRLENLDPKFKEARAGILKEIEFQKSK